MKTVVLYGSDGTVYFSLAGSDIPQEELQNVVVDIPDGKMLKGINTSVTPNEPIYEDVPKSEIQIANERIAELETALVELASLVGGDA